MVKKAISHIGTSLAIGYVVTTACLWIFKAYEGTGFSVLRMVTVWMAASALYGVISLIYDTELALPLSVALHLLGCALVTFAASAASGLFGVFSSWTDWFIYVLPVFALLYVIIGAVIAVGNYFQARRINKKIK